MRRRKRSNDTEKLLGRNASHIVCFEDIRTNMECMHAFKNVFDTETYDAEAFKQQLSEYMSSFSALQGMSKQESQQNGSQQSMVQNTGLQEEMSQTGSQQSSLQQGMNQSNGQQVKPQQNMNQSGSQQGDSQQSTESSQSGEKQENLSHGKETGKENSEVPCQDGEKNFEEDLNCPQKPRP